MKTKIYIALSLIFILAVAGILVLAKTSNSSINTGPKLKVIATTTQLADIVQNIAGDKIDLATLLKPAVDPHEYETTSDDAKKISDADLIIENGVGLEKKIEELIKNSVNSKVIVVSDVINLEKSEAEEGGYDPHIWFSVENVKKITTYITQTLNQDDAGNRDFYNKNEIVYQKKLDDLEKYIKNKVAELPQEKRKLVTNHDAFGYYAKEFGLTIVGSIIPNLSTDTEPSAQETADLINKIKAEKVSAIFTESSINPKLEQQIADEAGIKVVANLYGDTLGEKDSQGGTYIDMMKYNTDTIINNLK